MNFGLSQEIDEDVLEKAQYITHLSNKLTAFFETKNYGEGITILTIGVICIHPQAASFFKIRRKYSKTKKLFEYDVKLDHAKVLSAESNDVLLSILRSCILDSLSNFEENIIKQFDLTNFRKDLTSFFDSLNEDIHL